MFTILCGDGRLPERFRSADLLPLGSRIGPRLTLTPLVPEQLQDYLNFALQQAFSEEITVYSDTVSIDFTESQTELSIREWELNYLPRGRDFTTSAASPSGPPTTWHWQRPSGS